MRLKNWKNEKIDKRNWRRVRKKREGGRDKTDAEMCQDKDMKKFF